ncbi:MAG: PspC domain-containing protein [Desulfurococcales archaeon]|nr:PspC domain-containing protein [Desulfurococcales archaeon]
MIQVIGISQGQILRSSRERVLTGLIGGLSRYLGLSPGISRLVFLAVFAISIFSGLWLLFLAVYMLVSAVIPRDDDPEDLRAKGFVIKVDRLILSLIALILLGIGAGVLIYSLALLGISFGINVMSLTNPPMVLAGILAFIVAVLGIIAGLAIMWLGFQFAKRV